MGSKAKPLKAKFLNVLTKNSSTSAPSRNFIANLYPWHCNESISALARYAFARQRIDPRDVVIRILAHTLLDAFYDDRVTASFKNYMNHSGSIRILLAQRPPNESGTTLTQLEEFSKEFTRRGAQSPFEVKISPIIDRVFPQFMLVGDSAYRVEAAHVPLYDSAGFRPDSPELPARACFNDPHGGQQLMISFDLLWRIAGGQSNVQEALSSAVDSFSLASTM